MKKHDFESRKEALLKDIQDVMSDVEELYSKGVARKRAKKPKPNCRRNLKLPRIVCMTSKKKPATESDTTLTARVKNTTNLKKRQKSVSEKAKNALPSLEKKQAASNAAHAKPMQPYTTNLITQWALPHWRAWSSAYC